MSLVGRRQFLATTGALLTAPAITRAQPPKTLPVLGVLSLRRQPTPDEIDNSPFTRRRHELGWIEGKTLRIERAYAAGDRNRLPELAKALVDKSVDVIWTEGVFGAVAAARATKTIPIVFWNVAFPVELGLVNSLARPGGNATGLAWFADEGIYLKRYELLRDLLPNAKRVAQIAAPPTKFRTVSGEVAKFEEVIEKTESGVRKLGFELLRTEMVIASDFARVVAEIEKWDADCLNVFSDDASAGASQQIIEFATRKRLPAIYAETWWVEAGGLFSYGILPLPTLLRTMEMVDKILRGAKPSEIPVELPHNYEMVVSLRTARELGIRVPQSILLRANRVIA